MDIPTLIFAVGLLIATLYILYLLEKTRKELGKKESAYRNDIALLQDKLEQKANEFTLERERLYGKMERVLTKQHGFSDEAPKAPRKRETAIQRKMRIKTESEHPSI